MTAYQDATALLNHASDELIKLQSSYNQSLASKSVSAALLIAIKNICENLRSALDFVSIAIHQRYCDVGTSKSKIAFPYAKIEMMEDEFRKLLTKKFVGLEKKHPDLFKFLIDVQHFGNKGFTWLPTFMEMNNESKHQRLIPQVRREQKQLRISNGGAGIFIPQGASITLGHGASISIGGAIISGSQTLSTDRLPNIQGGNTKIITWVSFHFESNDQPVIPFLTTARNGIREIVETLSK